MTKVVIDQIGNKIKIPDAPERIISTVPSQTELLFFLGMQNKIAGITEYCVHPQEKVSKIPKIGGPKNLDIPKIREINPDLIIANKEENTKKQIEELAQEFPVWTSDIHSLEDAYKMIERVGVICNHSDLAQNTTSNLEKSINLLTSNTNIKIAYVIWENPYMVAGGDTFVNDVLSKIGFINVFENKPRYPKITTRELHDCNADFILLSSEPYPFSSQHIDSFKNCCPGSKVILVNGQFFTWYGNRVLLAVNYFKSIKNVILTIYNT
ncbi:ABC transporter substrate-binding protein [Bacteroidota bacterium]